MNLVENPFSHSILMFKCFLDYIFMIFKGPVCNMQKMPVNNNTYGC